MNNESDMLFNEFFEQIDDLQQCLASLAEAAASALGSVIKAYPLDKIQFE